MDTPRKRHLNLVKRGGNSAYVNTEFFIEEQNDALLASLAAMMGRDPSYIMNEAIGELIRRYQPAGRNRPVGFRLIKT